MPATDGLNITSSNQTAFPEALSSFPASAARTIVNGKYFSRKKGIYFSRNAANYFPEFAAFYFPEFMLFYIKPAGV
jgi:hypothetical protein